MARDRRYRYQPLKDPEDEIRILRILPSEELDEIRCALETCSLKEKPFYVALSYECGEPEPTIEIKVDGKALDIRLNLYLLLQHLILMKPDVLRADHFRLWADAICIHQGDDAEKAVQVRNMGRIFQQADFVYAWLGYSTNFDAKNTFRLMKDTSRRQIQHQSQETETWLCTLMNEPLRNSYFSSVQTMFKNLDCLVQLSYWTRRWILQEILLAREVHLLCDQEELHWTAMRVFLERMTSAAVSSVFREAKRNLGLSWSDFNLEASIPLKMHYYAGRLEAPRDSSVISLKNLLYSFTASRCQLPQDRIFCLVNLLRGDYKVKVDYECSLTTLFARLVTPKAGGHLDLDTAALFVRELGLSDVPLVSEGQDYEWIEQNVKCSQMLSVIDMFKIDGDVLLRDTRQRTLSMRKSLLSEESKVLRDLNTMIESFFNVELDTRKLIKPGTIFNRRIECSIYPPDTPSALWALVTSTRRLITDLSRESQTPSSAAANPGLRFGVDVNSQSEKIEADLRKDPATDRSVVHIICDNGSIGIASSCVELEDLLVPIDGFFHLVLRISSGQLQIIGAAYIRKGYRRTNSLRESFIREQQRKYAELEKELGLSTLPLDPANGNPKPYKIPENLRKVLHRYNLVLQTLERQRSQTEIPGLTQDRGNSMFNSSDDELVIRFNPMDMTRFAREAERWEKSQRGARLEKPQRTVQIMQIGINLKRGDR